MASTHTLLVIYKAMAIFNAWPLTIFTCETKGTFPSLSQRYIRVQRSLCKDAHCSIVGIKGTWKPVEVLNKWWYSQPIKQSTEVKRDEPSLWVTPWMVSKTQG